MIIAFLLSVLACVFAPAPPTVQHVDPFAATAPSGDSKWYHVEGNPEARMEITQVSSREFTYEIYNEGELIRRGEIRHFWGNTYHVTTSTGSYGVLFLNEDGGFTTTLLLGDHPGHQTNWVPCGRLSGRGAANRPS